MKLKVTLFGAPRTLKTSPVIVRHVNRPVLLPSEAYREWLKVQLWSKMALRSSLGNRVPVTEPCSINAQVYRESNTGDWTGFVQAIADAIQAEVWTCETCRKKSYTAKCVHCPGYGKRTRDGLGLILDDKLVQHWDGTRLLVDRLNPRIDLVVETIPGQESFELKEEEVSIL